MTQKNKGRSGGQNRDILPAIPPSADGALYFGTAGKHAVAQRTVGAAVAAVWGIVALCLIAVEQLRTAYGILMCCAISCGCAAICVILIRSAFYVKNFRVLTVIDQSGITVREGRGYRKFTVAELGVVTLRICEDGEELLGSGKRNLELSQRGIYYEIDGKVHVAAIGDAVAAARAIRKLMGAEGGKPDSGASADEAAGGADAAKE